MDPLTDLGSKGSRPSFGLTLEREGEVCQRIFVLELTHSWWNRKKLIPVVAVDIFFGQIQIGCSNGLEPNLSSLILQSSLFSKVES